MSNCGVEPVTLGRGQQVGAIEPATVAPADDPLWTEEEGQVLLCQTDDIGTQARVEELRQQLKFGEDMATEDKNTLSRYCYLMLMCLPLQMRSWGKQAW